MIAQKQIQIRADLARRTVHRALKSLVDAGVGIERTKSPGERWGYWRIKSAAE